MIFCFFKKKENTDFAQHGCKNNQIEEIPIINIYANKER